MQPHDFGTTKTQHSAARDFLAAALALASIQGSVAAMSGRLDNNQPAEGLPFKDNATVAGVSLVWSSEPVRDSSDALGRLALLPVLSVP